MMSNNCELNTTWMHTAAQTPQVLAMELIVVRNEMVHEVEFRRDDVGHLVRGKHGGLGGFWYWGLCWCWGSLWCSGSLLRQWCCVDCFLCVVRGYKHRLVYDRYMWLMHSGYMWLMHRGYMWVYYRLVNDRLMYYRFLYYGCRFVLGNSDEPSLRLQEITQAKQVGECKLVFVVFAMQKL